MLNSKLPEVKVFRDPIHTYISVDYQIIWDLLSTFEMQRLRRIKQLGGTRFVFSSAEHSRFTHSLGVYEIARRLINEVKDINNALTEEEQIILLCAAMLHDIGHGPFSHCFHLFHPHEHEEYTIRLIEEDSEVNTILKKYQENLPQEIAKVIAKKHPKKILNQLISSQIDADRMDYLLRDAYFTGTPYGYFDVDRLLRIIRVRNDQIVFKKSGLSAIENYILGRYHMYGQVYYHPVSLSYEIMVIKFLNRLKDLFYLNYKFNFSIADLIPLFGNDVVTNKEYLMLDDYTIQEYIKKASFENDVILKDLATCLMHRKLFKYRNFNSYQEVETFKKDLLAKSIDLKYYFYSIATSRAVYKSYDLNDKEAVAILYQDESICELCDASIIVRSLMNPQLEANQQIVVFYKEESL